MTMTTTTPQTIRWFPRLSAGIARDAAPYTETLASVAWLLMTELHAYLEDLEGAVASPDVVAVLRIKVAELLSDIDNRLEGLTPFDELHQFPMLLEYGLTQVAHANGEQCANCLGIGAEGDAAEEDASASPAWQEADARRLITLLESLLAGFPGELFNPLLPGTQGQVLRTLRAWDKLCRATGRDTAFLVPLMKSL